MKSTSALGCHAYLLRSRQGVVLYSIAEVHVIIILFCYAKTAAHLHAVAKQ